MILYLLSALSAETQRVPAAKPAFSPRAATACAVVTRAEIEDAIGRRVNAGNEESGGAYSTCDYSAGGGMVSITVQRLASRLDWKLEIASMKKSIPNAVVRQAAGFPEAVYLDIPEAGTQLHIVTANREHLMVSILGFGAPASVSGAAAQIARKALRRL